MKKTCKWRVNTKLEYIEKHSGKQTLVLSNNHIIAETFGKTLEEAEVNARLIASAPELLEALKVMTSLCRIKYGNLDKEVYTEILKSEQAIINAEVII